jgi:hypothetical protein
VTLIMFTDLLLIRADRYKNCDKAIAANISLLGSWGGVQDHELLFKILPYADKILLALI